MTMTARDDIESKTQKIAALINAARRLLADGQIVDLSALQGKVKELCLTIESNPPNEESGIKESVNEIILSLDSLARDVQSQFDGLAGSLGATTLQNATKAYQATPKKE